MSASTVISFPPDSFESRAAMERYRVAYRVAETAMRFAETIKYGSIFGASAMLVVAALIYQASPSERFGTPLISVSLAVCAILAALIAHLGSTIFRVQAQLLEIAIDAAVNTSPMLSNPQRVMVMSRAEEAPTLESERKKAA